jgi:hypothetical protein
MALLLDSTEELLFHSVITLSPTLLLEKKLDSSAKKRITF